MFRTQLCLSIAAAAVLGAGALRGQTLGEKERITANAIVSDERASGAGTVQIEVTRWSLPAERNALLQILHTHGAHELLDALRETMPVGTIKTPDSLSYDLHYAYQTPLPEGGRRIVLATDRPISFWEAANSLRTLDYPFTVIQMEVNTDGRGKGTMSYATKVIAQGDTIVLEHFSTQPVMLTEIRAEKVAN